MSCYLGPWLGLDAWGSGGWSLPALVTLLQGAPIFHFLFKDLLILFLYVYECFVCMIVWRSEEVFRSPGAGVMSGYELAFGCWEPNQGPQEK